MQIKNVNELRSFLWEMETTVNGDISKNLWVSSKQFQCLDDLMIDGKRGIPYVGFSNHGTMDVDRDLFLYFFRKDTDFQRHRSLLDMNVPENGYNDWRLFTTREEAEAHCSPQKKWELGAVYKVADPKKRESYWGLGGELECVFVDDELEQCLVKNHKGLHLLGIHMRDYLTKVRG